MKITIKDIVDGLLGVWPEMEYPWIYDRGTFYAPSLSVVQRAMETSFVPNMQVVGEFNDCDDFALHFIAEFRRKQYLAWEAKNLPVDRTFPAAIGIVFGDKFRAEEILHQCCVGVLEEGIYLIDPYPGVARIWKADPKNDNVIKLAYM